MGKAIEPALKTTSSKGIFVSTEAISRRGSLNVPVLASDALYCSAVSIDAIF